MIAEKTLPDEKAATTVFEQVRARTDDINATGEKFRRQLRRLIEATASDPNGVAILKDRCARAIEYFTGQIATQLVAPLREHIGALGHKKKMKRYLRHLQRVEESCWSKIERLYSARFLDERLYKGEALHARTKSTPAVNGERQEKGNTRQDTLELHRQGKTAEEIAAMRGLTVGTIKSHLARLIASGAIKVHEVLPAGTIDPVLDFLRENANANLTAIRKGTGDKFDYNDIRMIVAHQTHSRSRE